MAVSFINKRGFVAIPQDLGASFVNGNTVYVVREFHTNRWYITAKALSGGERFCKTKIVNGGLYLPEDVISFMMGKEDPLNVSMSLRKDNEEERCYLKPLTE